MTRAPQTPPLAFNSIEDIAAAVRRGGGRLSAARRLVLELLFDAEGPLSAEYLVGELARRGDHVDVSSVYRSLEHLEGLGAVRHVHLGHGPARRCRRRRPGGLGRAASLRRGPVAADDGGRARPDDATAGRGDRRPP